MVRSKESDSAVPEGQGPIRNLFEVLLHGKLLNRRGKTTPSNHQAIKYNLINLNRNDD
jgi:hypothetical protein